MQVPDYISAVREPLDVHTGNSSPDDCVICASKIAEESHVVVPWISDEHVSLVPATTRKSISTSRRSERTQQEEADRRLAEKLQAELHHDPKPSSSLVACELSPDEKAFDFTMRLIACFEKMVEELPVEVPISSDQDSNLLIHPALEFTLVNTDVLVFQAEKGA
jgi:hypothetical protein